MISALFFTWFGAACIWTVNALRRPVPPSKRFPPLWLPGMLVSEFAPWYLIGRAVVAALLLSLGALDLMVGRIGLLLFFLSELGLLFLIRRSWAAAHQAGHSPRLVDLWNVWIDLPKGVVAERDVGYHADLTLDIYRRPGVVGAPALIYLHPGSWMRGRPGRQARPLLYRMAEDGWVVLDIRYPLSPSATFPEHLIGVKAAIVWAKTMGLSYGIDPDRIALAGGSSGAHLAALAALTSSRSDLNPSTTETDTTVMACAPHYGIYDLLVRNATRYDWPFVAKHVMKSRPEDNPDLYRLGSPIDLVDEGAPPFLVVHGELDSVVLSAESRHFVNALKAVGARVDYLEVIGGQHGFDAYPTLRSRAVGHFVADFLAAIANAGQVEGESATPKGLAE